MKRQFQLESLRGILVDGREDRFKRANVIFFAIKKDNFEGFGVVLGLNLASLPFGFGSIGRRKVRVKKRRMGIDR